MTSSPQDASEVDTRNIKKTKKQYWSICKERAHGGGVVGGVKEIEGDHTCSPCG